MWTQIENLPVQKYLLFRTPSCVLCWVNTWVRGLGERLWQCWELSVILAHIHVHVMKHHHHPSLSIFGRMYPSVVFVHFLLESKRQSTDIEQTCVTFSQQWIGNLYLFKIKDCSTHSELQINAKEVEWLSTLLVITRVTQSNNVVWSVPTCCFIT